MIWPWSLQECATLDISFLIIPAILVGAFVSCCSANTIFVEQDIQAAVDEASSGDTIIVDQGECLPFKIDKPLDIRAKSATIRAGIQSPGIIVDSDNVNVSGFLIQGVGEDYPSKFSYYMNNPLAAATKLNLPNAAIIVNGNHFSLENTTIFGAQVGIYAYSASNISLINDTFNGCQKGTQLLNCFNGCIENCTFYNCDKTGIDLEGCSGLNLRSNNVSKTTHVGVMLKESESCELYDNVFSWNTEGLALWNSTYINVTRNRVDHNYYGILISQSNYNIISENLADENSRSEIVKGFGVGISLQENSSFNIVAGNTAKGSFNGLEVLRGCKINTIYGNNASDNVHGIRMDKSKNNIIYGNNFIRNKINAYENSSKNIWNTTFGNFYSDYRDKDQNNDGIGDKPYHLTGQDSQSFDAKPLMQPFNPIPINVETLKSEASNFAGYFPEDEIMPFNVVDGAIVIQYKKSKEPPKWPKSNPLF
ncbi:MAG: right-handed parallel beta-helix repeat-containing protein [Methanotrichaceae archaeon]|nr:right-handed parallel beta-helix repeat-containing protein [Methanotrichaceae archaeon]